METRSEPLEYVTYRRYKCMNCGELIYTEEYRVVDDEAKGQIYYIKKNKLYKKLGETYGKQNRSQ